MDKRIGKILFISLFSCIISCNDKAARLYLQDMEQNPIRQVEMSVPFLLQVVLDNVEDASYPDFIDGFEKLQVTKYGTSQTTSIVNGKKTERKIFNYVLRADKKDAYKVGPVIIKDSDGTTITSDIIHFHAGDKAVSYNLKKQSYFLQVQVDKKSVFVGQDITLAIRFYHNQDFDQLKIVEPMLDGVKQGGTLQGPSEGQETTRGQEYQYKEWKMKVYPEKVGTTIIPAIQAIFTMPSSDLQHGLRGLFDVFQMNTEKTVYSSPRSVEVKSLPESDTYKNVSAIGKFDKADLSLQKKQADVGEGVVATISVQGEGNMDMIKAPKLQLPDGLRYYESNSTVDNNIKNFEYILQADQKSSFTISSQTFVYFDPIEERYKTLQTNKEQLDIVADIQKTQVVDQDKNAVQADVKQADQKYIFQEDQIDYINESGMVAEMYDESIIQQIFRWLVILLGLLSLIAGFYWIYIYVVGVPLLQTYWLSYIIVRFYAYRAYQRKDVHALYDLFKHICKKSDLDLHEHKIVQVFKKMGYSDQKIKQWNEFVQKMMHVLFSGTEASSKEKQAVLQQGMIWIKELLACCRFVNSVQYQSINKV